MRCEAELVRFSQLGKFHLRGSTETSVHLDDHVFAAFRVESVLNVTFTNDTDMSHDLDCDGSKHVVLFICQSLRRSDDDGITRMCSEGVEVFHVAANDGVLGKLSEGNLHAGRLNLTSAASRTTSYSTSFHPFKLFSIRICGERLKLLADKFRSSSSS